MRFRNELALIMIVGLGCLVVSCGGNNNGMPDVSSRGISISASLPGTSSVTIITETAPVLVNYIPFVSLKGSDQADYSNVRTVWVDPGDGNGWQDVTGKWLNYTQLLASGAAIEPEKDMITHTYTMQGHFTMEAKVEYTDGEVHHSRTKADYNPQPSIHVLPYAGETVVTFTDPRDQSTYDIIDGRVIISFKEPLDRAAADQFIADKELSVINEWWEVAGIGAVLPARYSVLEAVRDWPGEYPGLIDAVDPDALMDATSY